MQKHEALACVVEQLDPHRLLETFVFASMHGVEERAVLHQLNHEVQTGAP